ncbi:Transcriptional regulator, LysR family [Paraburkholderia piptadeniae]|uniref:LysR family transcriptional regulator n=2 Tax=Paraburkholderia TaxID=1822464 RepID=A0A7X1NEJ0_9BURK|nr:MULTISPECIES: LysR family transcriptional regulator [Paraburkholderia]MPW20419.1 LysR family transcriptional regulator [Paraburkholderia franconis]SIT50947.1 Transcriptional regulator, LysR family [Paraburkholderia piptadeniae]
MSLNAYEVFVAIAERGSFAAAAYQLSLSPSAVSHALASFEQELGFALFMRNRSGVRLTAGGEALLPTVREVLQCNDKLKQQASKLLGLESGTVRIGAFSSVSVMWLPNIIRTFTELYPNIQVVIEQGGYDDVAEWILKSQVDLGFITLPAAPGLDVTPLYADPLLCITPPGFEPRSKAYMTVAELAEHNVVLQGEDYGKETQQLLMSHKISVKSSARAIDDAAIIAIVESGLGVSVMPRLAMLNYRSSVQAFPFYPAESRAIVLASLSQEGLAPAAKAMHKHIADSIAAWTKREGGDQS